MIRAKCFVLPQKKDKDFEGFKDLRIIHLQIKTMPMGKMEEIKIPGSRKDTDWG